MRYLIFHLVWEGKIWQAYEDGDWLIANGDNGYRLIPLWPSEECGYLSLKPIKSFNFRVLDVTSIEDDLLSKMYDDELIAAFPSPKQEYEMLTVEEFRKALRYAQLMKLGREDKLTSNDAQELGRYIKLKLKGS